MIAITLNLLAEEQQAQEARARDPVKLFTAIGLAAVTLAVAWGGTLSALLMQRRAELDGLQAQWNKMNEVGVGEGDFQKVNAVAQEIVALNHSRILVAPQLALVKDLIPPTIQLSQIGLTLSVDAADEGALDDVPVFAVEGSGLAGADHVRRDLAVIVGDDRSIEDPGHQR